MQKITNVVIAVALVVIAANSVLTSLKKQPESAPPQTEERVVQVLGRVSSVFDGMGVEIGFLVKDGDDLKIVKTWDLEGQAKEFKPQYLRVTKMGGGENGRDYIADYITVDPS